MAEQNLVHAYIKIV